MADIRDLFLERAGLYFYQKQIDPSFRLMLPQYFATTYILISDKKYLKPFAFIFIPVRVCGVASGITYLSEAIYQ